MEVINDLLGYEGLKIYQNPEMFSFSIDSMILGYFATINKKVNKIIDLCTGNAPIPLYLTLRTKAHIVGVEIQKKVYELAVKSVKINNKENDITLLNEDLKGVSDRLKEKFDLVTCNPPYFKYIESSNINKSEFKTIARHEVFCTLEDILSISSQLLNSNGSFYMVHRIDRLVDVLVGMRAFHLEPKRIRLIHPFYQKAPNLFLVQGIKGAKPFLKMEEPIYVYDEKGNYTCTIKEIYQLGDE